MKTETETHPVLQSLVSNWKVICLFGAAGGLLFLFVGFLLPSTYKADVLLAPAHAENSALGLFAGLASRADSLGGLGMSNWNISSRADEAVAILTSRALTESFVRDRNLLPVLFPDAWDADQKQWRVAADKVPTLWDANKLFSTSIRDVTEDRKTGLVTLSIEWRDATTAAAWANQLVAQTNEHLRNRAIAKSTRNIDYIKQQLDSTTVLETRQVLYNLLEAEYKNIMLAQGSDDYAFVVLDPAVAPKKPHKPRRLLLAAFGAGLGVFLSLLSFTIAEAFRKVR